MWQELVFVQTQVFFNLQYTPIHRVSGVARAFPELAHPEGKNEESLRKNKKKWWKFEEKWGKWNTCPPGTVRLAMPLHRVVACLVRSWADLDWFIEEKIWGDRWSLTLVSEVGVRCPCGWLPMIQNITFYPSMLARSEVVETRSPVFFDGQITLWTGRSKGADYSLNGQK